MLFLKSTDYNKQIQSDNLNQIISNDTSLLDGAELVAMSEITSYLVQRYDTALIFQGWTDTETPDTRNQQIVMYMVDICLYHLHSRINPRNIPELRGIRYDNAINWLKMVAAGKITANLPLSDDDPNTGGSIRFGTAYTKNQNFY